MTKKQLAQPFFSLLFEKWNWKDDDDKPCFLVEVKWSLKIIASLFLSLFEIECDVMLKKSEWMTKKAIKFQFLIQFGLPLCLILKLYYGITNLWDEVQLSSILNNNALAHCSTFFIKKLNLGWTWM